MTITSASALATARAIAAGNISAVEVARAHLDRIAALDHRHRAVTDVLEDRALSEAGRIDRARARRETLPPLAGVPFLVKILFDIAGLPTRAGSKINRTAAPAIEDSEAIRRLEGAGAMLLGACNMGEYAYDFTGRNAHDGHVGNPHDPSRLAGGSSSGSAAAVAAGYAPVSLGSDTNDSVRVPASLCGLFGLKPTYGAISRRGTFPFVASLDHVGLFARDVADAAALVDALAGHDPEDPVSRPDPVAPLLPSLDDGIADVRAATLGGYFRQQVGDDAAAAVATVAAALKAGRYIELPEAHRARAAAFVITTAEGGALHLERLRWQAAEFDPETRDRFIAGAMTPAAWVFAAQRFRAWFRARVAELLQQVDLLIAPATPVTAPGIEDMTFEAGGKTLFLGAHLGLFTQPISFIGLPALTVPLVAPNGLPIGVQLAAAPGREDVLIRAARVLERAGLTWSIVVG
jgi:aspartyl-tRNA(Asn)/glutamyl-tRNA(Gln) amidotransferase subunit A